MTTLVNARRIAEGTTLVFRTRTAREHEQVDGWLAEDARRRQATWINHRTRPLLWAHDGEQYAPTTLVKKIWEHSGWRDSPRAVQGPSQWYIPDEGSLWEIAKRIQDDEEPGEEEDE